MIKRLSGHVIVLDLDKFYTMIKPYVDIDDWATRDVLINSIFCCTEVKDESTIAINPSKDESSGVIHHRKICEELNENQIYNDAISIFGAENQIMMMFEEMSELQKEMCKNLRGRDNKEEIAEELADVYIMLQQMIVLFDCKKAFDYHKDSKLRRLEERIKYAKQNNC